MTIHSLTGASSAKRWMNCNGYLYLAKTAVQEAGIVEIDPEWTREGTLAHEIGAQCLAKDQEPWEFMGLTKDGVTIGMEDNQVSPLDIQVFVDECRKFMGPEWEFWIETAIGEDPKLRPHPGFFGTLDFGAVQPGRLVIRDLKFGRGVFVDAVENEQIMYYAYGMILHLHNHGTQLAPETVVDLGIVQPRIYDDAGSYEPVRTWETTVDQIMSWGINVLIPAMHQATTAVPEFHAGEWCKFCPHKVRCPALRGMFRAAVIGSIGISEIPTITGAELGNEYLQIPFVEMYIKALKEATFSRLQAGQQVNGTKLVKKKADRVWKEGALPALANTYGDMAYNPASLKSPAQMEKISSEAKQLTAQWAFIPDTGLTVALETDRRPREKVATAAETFAHFLGGSQGS